MLQRSGTVACPALLWGGSYAIGCRFGEVNPQAECSTSTPKSTIISLAFTLRPSREQLIQTHLPNNAIQLREPPDCNTPREGAAAHLLFVHERETPLT